MKNIIITGANGQLGKVFVSHLLESKKYKIYALDVSFTNLEISTDLLECIVIDITNEQEVVNFFKSLENFDCYTKIIGFNH